MSQIPFTVSARTAKLIGQENFSNAEGAIIELVKNTYDADSQYCFILFENIGTLNATIYIIDFGCGMNDTTIQNCWMTIGTDDKLFNIKSAKFINVLSSIFLVKYFPFKSESTNNFSTSSLCL